MTTSMFTVPAQLGTHEVAADSGPLATEGIQSAIDACRAAAGGTVELPAGASMPS